MDATIDISKFRSMAARENIIGLEDIESFVNAELIDNGCSTTRTGQYSCRITSQQWRLTGAFPQSMDVLEYNTEEIMQFSSNMEVYSEAPDLTLSTMVNRGFAIITSFVIHECLNRNHERESSMNGLNFAGHLERFGLAHFQATTSQGNWNTVMQSYME